MKNTILILVIIILAGSFANSQYLEVSRAATVKEHPAREALVIENVKKGDKLKLLDNGEQQNGYYKVNVKSNNQIGWIYRTLVRRYEGSIPNGYSKEAASLNFEPEPTNYYSEAKNLDGTELKKALHGIIKDHREYSYGELWEILKETDIDPNDKTRVIGIYSGFSMSADSTGNGWNREHVWSKSYGDFGTSDGAGTDLHHLRAEDVSTNSARNNRSFDECNVQYIDNSGIYSGQTQSFTDNEIWIWEPRDAVKGDVARMLFYMAVRYEGDEDEPDLELTDNINDKSSKEPKLGKFLTLLKWHKQDPVDNYERYRNHIIFTKYQHNRNPFIDHPEFVERIWGN